MHEYCAKFNVEPFLMVDEWKSVLEIEAVLKETSRLTTIYQNEEKLYSAFGPAMRGRAHDRWPSDAIACVDVDNWSSKKDLMHPKRSKVRVSAFTEAGEICLE